MRRKELPALTHLQFLVLGVLRANEQPGRVIRQAIATYGVRRSGPAFYQMMARLERDGLIEGWYEQITRAGGEGASLSHQAGGRETVVGHAVFYESVSVAAARPSGRCVALLRLLPLRAREECSSPVLHARVAHHPGDAALLIS